MDLPGNEATRNVLHAESVSRWQNTVLHVNFVGRVPTCGVEVFEFGIR